MKIGILGAGQLGRMLALAGYPLGLEFRFFDPNSNSPARSLGEFVNAGYDDIPALQKFVSGVDVVTTEFENISVDAISVVEQSKPFYPGIKAVSISQDRLSEKEFFSGLGFATAPFKKIDSLINLEQAAELLGFPLILKTRRLGYDGKGQRILQSKAQMSEALTALGSRDLLAEGFVRFSRELSIIAVRSVRGEVAYYPLNVNTHINGILSRTVVSPGLVAPELQKKAEHLASKALEALSYVGVLVIELFETDQGLVVNEMAPRVHNSGHWSIEGASSSQFENHLRAICDLPLGNTALYGHCAMLNVLHTRPDTEALMAIAGAKLHWYGKEPHPGRKLGHLTFVEDSRSSLEAKLALAEKYLQF